MATKKTLDEKIAETKLKKEQAENQLKQLLQRKKEAERKARTHRLIERGAMLESMIDGADALVNEQVKTILAAALNSEAAIESVISVQEQMNTAQATEAELPLLSQPAKPSETTQGAGA